MMFKFDNEKSIYLQIYDDILTKIFRGELKFGEKLPSVRELAIVYTVNPNTIQKVVTELERQGVVFIERGRGTFMTDDIHLIEKMKTKVIQDEITQFINKLINMGMKHQDIMKEVKEMLSEVISHD